MAKEIFSHVPARQFRNALKRASRSKKVREYTHLYSTDEYSLMKCYLTSDETCGFALKDDGDIVSVFNVSTIRGLGAIAVRAAIELGGIKLDCFDGFLPSYYAQFGFTEYQREPNWYGAEYPDVIYMILLPPTQTAVNLNSVAA